MATSPSHPNNLGPTLLIVVGAWMIQVGVGIPIMLYALSLLRTKEGARTYGWLNPFPRRIVRLSR